MTADTTPPTLSGELRAAVAAIIRESCWVTPGVAQNTADAILAAVSRPSAAEDGWREALKPFAAVSRAVGPKGKDDACWCGQDGAVIRYGDLRRAEALCPPPPQPAVPSSEGEG